MIGSQFLLSVAVIVLGDLCRTEYLQTHYSQLCGERCSCVLLGNAEKVFDSLCHFTYSWGIFK